MNEPAVLAYLQGWHVLPILILTVVKTSVKTGLGKTPKPT